MSNRMLQLIRTGRIVLREEGFVSFVRRTIKWLQGERGVSRRFNNPAIELDTLNMDKNNVIEEVISHEEESGLQRIMVYTPHKYQVIGQALFPIRGIVTLESGRELVDVTISYKQRLFEGIKIEPTQTPTEHVVRYLFSGQISLPTGSEMQKIRLNISARDDSGHEFSTSLVVYRAPQFRLSSVN